MPRKLTLQEVINRYKPDMPQPVDITNYKDSNTKIYHICPRCKKYFLALPKSIWHRLTTSCGCYQLYTHSCQKYSIFTNDQKSILDGLIISDGSLFLGYSHKPIRKINACFKQDCIHKLYLEYIKNVLPLPWNKTIYCRKSKKLIICNVPTTSSDSYAINTRSDKFLTEQYYRWYNNNKKQIPKNLLITPLMLKHWFYGDGYSTYVGRNGIQIGLCTNCFTYTDCKFLQYKLKEITNINFHINQYPINHYILRISSKTMIEKFFQYIGECDMICFKYKWKIYQ
jgi:hypothetical protein